MSTECQKLCMYLPKSEYKKLTDFLISAPEILTLCVCLCGKKDRENEPYLKVRQSADRTQQTHKVLKNKFQKRYGIKDSYCTMCTCKLP